MGNCPPNESNRPWEQWAISTPPGLIGSSLYNRVIDVHRTVTQAAQTPEIGDTGYSGDTGDTGTGVGDEQVIYTGVPCVISVKAAGRSKGPLPTDLVYRT